MMMMFAILKTDTVVVDGDGSDGDGGDRDGEDSKMMATPGFDYSHLPEMMLWIVDDGDDDDDDDDDES